MSTARDRRSRSADSRGSPAAAAQLGHGFVPEMAASRSARLRSAIQRVERPSSVAANVLGGVAERREQQRERLLADAGDRGKRDPRVSSRVTRQCGPPSGGRGRAARPRRARPPRRPLRGRRDRRSSARRAAAGAPIGRSGACRRPSRGATGSQPPSVHTRSARAEPARCAFGRPPFRAVRGRAPRGCAARQWRCPPAAVDPSSSLGGTRAISICMSMRSSSGPLTRRT